MPNLKTHNRVNTWLMLPLSVGSFYYYVTANYQLLIAFSVSFLYATFFASPDMDLANQIKLISLRGFLTLPFRILYAPFVKHRGASHSLLFGTIGRLMTMIIFILMIIFVYRCGQTIVMKGFIATYHLKNLFLYSLETITFSFLSINKLSAEKQMVLAFGLGGFLVADISHIALDQLNTKLKFLRG